MSKQTKEVSTMNSIAFNDLLMLVIAIICITSVATLIFITKNVKITDQEIQNDLLINLRGQQA